MFRLPGTLSQENHEEQIPYHKCGAQSSGTK